MKFYYFHGFGSSPMATKANNMREILGNDNVNTPDFNLPSIEVKKLLDNLIDEIKSNNEESLIVGSSLGGLYAIYVSALSNCKCVLLNPCLFPQAIISKITNDVNIDDIIDAQNLSLKAYKEYNPSLIEVWVTDDDLLINHKDLTYPYFYKGVAKYEVFPVDKVSGHEFIGFKDVFKDYVKKYL